MKVKPPNTESIRGWSGRARVVQTVHTPLGFFVLALLIVEVFLLGAGIWFNLPDMWKIVAIAVGVILFLIVFFTVVYLVVAHPRNLVFSEESHVQFAAMEMFGTETHAITGKDIEALPNEPQAKTIIGHGQQPQLPDERKET